MMKNRPTPPEGYMLVDEGNVRKSDLCYNPYHKSWNYPIAEDYSILGSDVNFYYAVARRAI